MDEHQGRAERIVRWSLVDPIGWLALQIAEMFLAGAVVRAVVAVRGGGSTGFQWGTFGGILLVLAGVTYWVRRRYLADHAAAQADDDRAGAH
jgi:uncharacterized membrane protein HdeD (DUF308 family)